MKNRKIIAVLLVLSISLSSYAQSNADTVGYITYPDQIFTNEINGYPIFNSDSINIEVQKRLRNTNQLMDNTTPHQKVYITNNNKSQYLKIWGGPDLGYGWFYSIGYTKNAACSNCGTALGKADVAGFVINNGVKLGDSISLVWQNAHLNYFRTFTLAGVKYFYFEKGVRHEVPYTPNFIYYYKFKNDKLIEIGFGYGMIGVNPMLQ